MRRSRVEMSPRKFIEVTFDGTNVTAAAESSRVIKIQSHAVSEADLRGELAIRGGEGFVPGAYRICAVDFGKNTWTLDRSCCAGPTSGLIGEMARFQGEPHAEVPEYYDPAVPGGPGQGEARNRVLRMLDFLEPGILRSLAETCFKDELLAPKVSSEGDWPAESCEYLEWGHIRTAGDETVPGQAYFRNLKPLREELTRWAEGGPEKVWNLLDDEKRPIEWIASTAVQTLVWWKIRRELPKTLKWENFEWHAYRRLETVGDFRMFDLEGHFNRGAGFRRITMGNAQEQRRLSDREQRKAKREYVKLAKRRGLARMPGKISAHYFKWYVQYCFLGLRQREIRQLELDRGKGVIGNIQDPEDLASISIGIRIIADLVGFRRQSRKRTKKF